jgi:ABC-type spermidine/putrescine transport system permease subunit II
MAFDMKIFENSYIMAIVTFFVAYVVLYLLGIGYETKTVDGEEVKSMSYKYPLVIALIVWLIWYFYLYPMPTAPLQPKVVMAPITIISENSLPAYNAGGGANLIDDQKMITEYWY